MNTDELRDVIWEYLFKSKTTHSIDEIAALTECDITAVRAAVTHEWFTVAEERVRIAYVAADVHDPH